MYFSLSRSSSFSPISKKWIPSKRIVNHRIMSMPLLGAPEPNDVPLPLSYSDSIGNGIQEERAMKSSNEIDSFFDFMKPAPSVYAKAEEISYTAFLRKVALNEIRSMSVDHEPVLAEIQDKEGNLYIVRLPSSFQLDEIIKQDIDVFIRPENKSGMKILENIFNGVAFLVQFIVIGIIIQAIVGSRQSASQMLNTLSASSNEYDSTMPEVTFKDVAGLEGPKNELIEIVDFLKNPDKFASMGAVLPKGVLLTGSPGTGKTLLAKAVAGEAGVPFIFCSGSEFVQVFVGVGASRVRELFKKAREKAPCIIFIDEIDAIGRERSMNNSTGANTEQEQTMNQILTEMDGFKGSEGIVIIGATNRKEILDEALIRSGRFDRHVQIPIPSKKERLEILETHMKNKPISNDVSVGELASLTQGMVGADLKNLVNEAIIYTVRNEETEVSKEAFLKSLDKMVLGLENKSIEMTPYERRLIAYHEAGHALMGILTTEYDLLTQVTIVPRGNAGGLTVFQEKEQDMQLYSQQYLLNRLVVALGGRVAEEQIFGHLNTTTGAVSDLQNVQSLARNMVTAFGFNETLGQASWSDEVPISGSTSDAIDAEVKMLIDWAYRESTELMEANEFYLHRIAKALMEKNTLYLSDIIEAIEGLTCDIASKLEHSTS
jgi:cell division protease FtsH